MECGTMNTRPKAFITPGNDNVLLQYNFTAFLK